MHTQSTHSEHTVNTQLTLVKLGVRAFTVLSHQHYCLMIARASLFTSVNCVLTVCSLCVHCVFTVCALRAYLILCQVVSWKGFAKKPEALRGHMDIPHIARGSNLLFLSQDTQSNKQTNSRTPVGSCAAADRVFPVAVFGTMLRCILNVFTG